MDVNKNLIERNTQYIVIFSDQLHLQMCEDRDWKYMQWEKNLYGQFILLRLVQAETFMSDRKRVR